jgi:hypothetical protein
MEKIIPLETLSNLQRKANGPTLGRDRQKEREKPPLVKSMDCDLV